MQRSLLITLLLSVSILSLPTMSTVSNLTPSTQTLLKAYLDKGPKYQARTQHLEVSGQPKFINELILESSPYLLQHAHNPVNWHAWSDKTLAKAKQENKLIFLSIGYATCHWCHVMEEESFDDTTVAQVLNENFISIKVDREVRPDVDEVFMSAVQLINGHGGWPLNVILSPDSRAFFGGTYFPKVQLLSVLEQINELWQTQPKRLLAQADEVEKQLYDAQQTQKSIVALGDKVIDRAVLETLASFDEIQGGFGQAPKFPYETFLLLLLEEQKRKPTDNAYSEVLDAINISLIAMAQGGLYDVVGGGFARYSTDNAWLVPHFEKMLYNQAQLALVYAKAYQLTHNPLYERITRQTLDYVIKEMYSPLGGFYSATDADSKDTNGRSEEGVFFTWDLLEIQQILGKDLYKQAQKIFDFSNNTLFEGKHIIRYQDTLKVADYTLANTIISKLYPIRNQRNKPLLDNKILLSWNAMMAKSFLAAGQILAEPKYLAVAKQSFEFLQTFQTNPNQLKRVLLDAKFSTNALLEDYAHLIDLALDFYQDSNNPQPLLLAKKWMNQAIDELWDVKDFGFFNTSSTQLYLKNKSSEDGATSSANGIMLQQLARLAALSDVGIDVSINTNTMDYARYFEQALQGFSHKISKYPQYHASMVLALRQWLSGSMAGVVWLYQGKIRARLKKIPVNNPLKNAYQLSINLPKGYYINSNKPRQKELIATRIESLSPHRLTHINYPEVYYKTLSFSQDKLAIYGGDNKPLLIEFETDANANLDLNNYQPLILKLSLQACNTQVCLAPEHSLLID